MIVVNKLSQSWGHHNSGRRLFLYKPLFLTVLGFNLLAWPAMASCLLALQNQTYVQLPPGLCPGYTDTLIGTQGSHEYSSVICDRPENTYLFLQKLTGYTDANQAIWQIVTVKPIGQLDDNQIVFSVGCTQTNGNNEPLIAVVEDNLVAEYTTRSAWKVNLATQSFDGIDPSTVTCQDPFSTLP